MKSILVLVVLIVSAASFAGCDRKDASAEQTTGPAAAEIEWLTNFDAAKAQAQAQNKTLLINFTGSDWCPPCLMLEKEVFKQPEFAEYAAKNLVLLMVDFPRIKMQSLEEQAANRKLAERYGIYGFPTIVILDSDGKELGKLGYRPGGPKPFIAGIEKLREADATSTPER